MAEWEFTAHPAVLRRHATIWSITLPGAALMGWFLLPAGIRAQFTPLQIATLLMFLAIMLAMVWALAVAWVKAGPSGLSFRNGLRRHEVPWDRVESIRFGEHDAWAFVELGTHDLPLMGIMRSDGPRADKLAAQLQAVAAKYSR